MACRKNRSVSCFFSLLGCWLRSNCSTYQACSCRITGRRSCTGYRVRAERPRSALPFDSGRHNPRVKPARNRTGETRWLALVCCGMRCPMSKRFNRASGGGYFAYSTRRVSRMTCTLICPGYCISPSICLGNIARQLNRGVVVYDLRPHNDADFASRLQRIALLNAIEIRWRSLPVA